MILCFGCLSWLMQTSWTDIMTLKNLCVGGKLLWCIRPLDQDSCFLYNSSWNSFQACVEEVCYKAAPTVFGIYLTLYIWDHQISKNSFKFFSFFFSAVHTAVRVTWLSPTCTEIDPFKFPELLYWQYSLADRGDSFPLSMPFRILQNLIISYMWRH